MPKLIKVNQRKQNERNGSVRNNRGRWNHAVLKSRYYDPLPPPVFCVCLWSICKEICKKCVSLNDYKFNHVLDSTWNFSPSLNQSLVRKAIGWQRYTREEQHWEIAAVPLLLPLCYTKGNFHISSCYKFESSCSERIAVLFGALWQQGFPSDCASMPTFPENCQSCSNSLSTVNGQLKLCLSRVVIQPPHGLLTWF